MFLYFRYGYILFIITHLLYVLLLIIININDVEHRYFLFN